MTAPSFQRVPCLSKIVQLSQELKNEIKSTPSIEGAHIHSFIYRIANLRGELQSFQDKKFKVLFSTSLFKKVGLCTKNINKAQSLFLKKYIQRLSSQQQSDLNTIIRKIWARETGSATSNLQFGICLLANKKKDPLLITALIEQIRREKIQNFKEARSNKDWSEVLDFPLWESERCSSLPHFHHHMSLGDYQYLATCLQKNHNEKFIQTFSNLLHKETGTLRDAAYCYHFIDQNMTHPYVIETVYQFMIDFWLKDLLSAAVLGNLEKLQSKINELPQELKQTFDEDSNDGLNHLTAILYDLIASFEKKIESARCDPKRHTSIKIDGRFYLICTIQASLQDDLQRRSLSLQLEQNLEYAYEAISYAIRKIPYSANFLKRENTHSNFKSFSHDEFSTFEKRIVETRNTLVRRKIQKLEFKLAGHCKSSFSITIASAKTSETYPLGNCAELSASAFYYLLKQKKNIRLEIFKITEGDHLIVVIGRNIDSDARNYTSWSSDTVVCDVWRRMCYPAYLIKELLYDYTGSMIGGYPCIKKFDPANQSLELFTSNMMTLDELQNTSSSDDLVESALLEKLLHQFHALPKIKEKKLIASLILNVLAFDSFQQKENSIRTLLLHQMHYFLYKKLDRGPQYLNNRFMTL